MYVGRFTLGERFFAVLLGDRATARFDVNTPPTFTIYNAVGVKVLSGLVPPLDPYGAGKRLFALPVRLTATFGVGRYAIAFNYTTADTATWLKVSHFDVVAGGNAAGNVIAMTYYQRPHATFLVMRTDQDQRLLARNPYQ